MIKFETVTKSYKGTTVALRDVNVDIQKGEFVFLVGPSGSGKSTFLRLVTKEEQSDGGRVWVAGKEVGALSSWKVPYLRRNIGCVFQDFRLLPTKSVYDNVAFALEVIGRPRNVVRSQVPQILDLVGLGKKLSNLPHELSGGEQQRVGIARAFVNRPLILLADEPTGNLDPSTTAGIMRLLDRINRTGATVLMATHDNGIVDSMRRRVIELDRGTVIRDQARGVYGVGASLLVAISSSYVARETAGNLRRNLVMTLSAIITMAVSLSALGGVLIMRQAINKASIQWRGGVEMAIFLQPTIPANETAAIGHELASTPGVKKYHFVDKVQAYAEFKEIFGGNNDIVGVLGVNDMPPSYRVVPTQAGDISELGRQFSGQPGVLQVSYAQQEIDALLHQFKQLRLIGLFLAIGVMIGAVALIVNTIQLAIFARRREVAVMKLVGATNWFIRIPFMLEGLIHGIVGAIVAFTLTYFIRTHLSPFISTNLLTNNNPYVSPHDTVVTG